VTTGARGPVEGGATPGEGGETMGAGRGLARLAAGFGALGGA
jgi:hypothetical protein